MILAAVCERGATAGAAGRKPAADGRKAMPDFAFVSWVDAIGYLGGAVTLWAMHAKTMIPLRIGIIGGNVGFGRA